MFHLLVEVNNGGGKILIRCLKATPIIFQQFKIFIYKYLINIDYL